MENQEKKFKIPHVPHDAVFTIEVSGAFLYKCQSLLMAIGYEMGNEKLKLAIETFKNTNELPKDTQEAVAFMLMSLVGEMEDKAKAQNKIEYTEYTKEQLQQVPRPSQEGRDLVNTFTGRD